MSDDRDCPSCDAIETLVSFEFTMALKKIFTRITQDELSKCKHLLPAQIITLFICRGISLLEGVIERDASEVSKNSKTPEKVVFKELRSACAGRILDDVADSLGLEVEGIAAIKLDGKVDVNELKTKIEEIVESIAKEFNKPTEH